MKQRTLARDLAFEGVGVHTGKRSKVVLRPLPENSGIVVSFDGRKDLSFKVGPHSVVLTNRATGLGYEGRTVCTTEHLLSALYGLGVDNVLIEVYGSEIPVMDGSALKFCNFILEAGIEEQDAEKEAFYIERYVCCRYPSGKHSDRIIEFMPGKGLEIEYVIEYDHPLIGRQSYTFNFNFSSYYTEISPSRTFGFLKDYVWLKKRGLAEGASVFNTVVLSKDSYLNPFPLRFRDEFVRHKILDFIGDIALLGHFLVGKVRIVCGGHDLHYRGLKALMEENAFFKTSLNGVIKPVYPRKLLNIL